MKTAFLSLCALAFAVSCLSIANAQEPLVVTPVGPRQVGSPVVADQLNGIYRNGGNEFRILSQGPKKLKVQFNGEWMTRWGYPNLGQATSEATLEGNVATFTPGEAPKCKITLVFLSNRVKVTQEGTDADCGFGRNVMATGTYRRIKGGRPRFVPVTK